MILSLISNLQVRPARQRFRARKLRVENNTGHRNMERREGGSLVLLSSFLRPKNETAQQRANISGPITNFWVENDSLEGEVGLGEPEISRVASTPHHYYHKAVLIFGLEIVSHDNKLIFGSEIIVGGEG